MMVITGENMVKSLLREMYSLGIVLYLFTTDTVTVTDIQRKYH